MPSEQHDELDDEDPELHELQHDYPQQQYEHEHHLDVDQQLLDQHVWNQHEHFGY